MTNPLASKQVSKIADLALKQLNNMQHMKPSPSLPNNSAFNNSKGPSFQEVMQTKKSQSTQAVNGTQSAQKTPSIRNVVQTQKTNNVEQTFQALKKSKVIDYFSQLHGKKLQMDKYIRSAIRGKNFSTRDLIAMQYKVGAFSLEMSLTSKAVEKTSGGIKQAMNTQV
ncbi:MAG: hypothetical protein AAGJ35_00990 [Myxococcota bacterium]